MSKPNINEIQRYTITFNLVIKKLVDSANLNMDEHLMTLTQIVRKNIQEVLERDEYNYCNVYNDKLNSFDFIIWTRKMSKEEVEKLEVALSMKHLVLKDLGGLNICNLKFDGEWDE